MAVLATIHPCYYIFICDVHTLYLKFHHYAATTLQTQDIFRCSLTCVQKVAAASLIQVHQKKCWRADEAIFFGLKRTSQN